MATWKKKYADFNCMSLSIYQTYHLIISRKNDFDGKNVLPKNIELLRIAIRVPFTLWTSSIYAATQHTLPRRTGPKLLRLHVLA